MHISQNTTVKTSLSTLKDGTDRLSRNVGNYRPTLHNILELIYSLVECCRDVIKSSRAISRVRILKKHDVSETISVYIYISISVVCLKQLFRQRPSETTKNFARNRQRRTFQQRIKQKKCETADAANASRPQTLAFVCAVL
jgi:hypothetical protein